MAPAWAPGPAAVMTTITRPDTVLLAYNERRPRLRLVRVSEGLVEPAPVSLDEAYAAIDGCLPRDGWLAFAAHEEIWGIPSSFEEPAFRVGQSWGLVAGEDPRTIWLAPESGYDGRPSRFIEYDGVARAARRTVELEPGLRLAAAVSQGLVVAPVEAGMLYLHRWTDERRTDLVAGSYVLARHPARLAVEVDHRELVIFDVGRGTSLPVPRPSGSRWGTFSSFSPDGNLLAIGVEQDRSHSEEELLAGVWAALTTDERYEREPTRLALIDTTTGAVRLATGDFDNFATTPIWSADGTSAFFAAPFEDALWRCDATTPEPWLDRVLKGRAPVPRADVTSLLAQG
jgi:hypothetical protein